MSKTNQVKELFTAKKIAIPIVIGLAVAIYMLWKNTDWAELEKIEWHWQMAFWLVIALLMMVIRDLAYMYRIRVLTGNHLTWRNSFDVIMLWEFASAITPSVVGGTGVALYILNKEGISTGKSTALVMITALFDELFYIITVPLVIVFIGTQYLFPIELQKEIFGIVFSAKGIFIIGYGFTLLLALIIIYGLKKLSPSVVSTYIYLQPLLATVFAIWAGKDSLDWIKIVAAILIFSGVFMVSKTKTLKNQ